MWPKTFCYYMWILNTTRHYYCEKPHSVTERDLLFKMPVLRWISHIRAMLPWHAFFVIRLSALHLLCGALILPNMLSIVRGSTFRKRNFFLQEVSHLRSTCQLALWQQSFPWAMWATSQAQTITVKPNCIDMMTIEKEEDEKKKPLHVTVQCNLETSRCDV